MKNNNIVIGNNIISKGKMPYILAEMACAHDGSVELALQMVNDAADSGANGIQFQIFDTSNLLTPSHQFYELVTSLEISYKDWEKIFNVARSRGLDVFVNPLTVDAFEAIKGLGADVIKIHSADLSNPNMVEALASFNQPVSISSGGSTLDEVRATLELLYSKGIDKVILMHGFQSYPTLIEDSHLNYIATLEKEFDILVGYQDHIDGDSEMAKIVPTLAMSMGAVLLEKHITDSRERQGTDFQSSLDKKGFTEFVNLVKESYLSFGSSKKETLTESELKYREIFKKSIVAAKDIEEGMIISEDMVTFMRGDVLGFTPKEIDIVVGKKANKKIDKYEVIEKDFIN